MSKDPKHAKPASHPKPIPLKDKPQQEGKHAGKDKDQGGGKGK